MFQNRIIGFAEKPAKDFNFNPNNWRIHSEFQKNAISDVLSRVGWVTGVIENISTGNLLDGHARVEEALKLGPETPVPFLQVELSVEEENMILALLDPIGALASTDTEKLQELFDSIEFESNHLANIVTNLLPAEILEEIEKTPNLSSSEFDYENKFGVIVECENEFHQQQVFEKLSSQGLKVKVVVV